jgi:hypothetical protein
MAFYNRPQFWLQVRKDYILDNFENLIVYLNHYEYSQDEDNHDYDSTLECMRQLIDDIGSRIKDTPFYKRVEHEYEISLSIRLMCAHILASHKAGKTPYSTILTLTTLLAKSDINLDFDTLSSLYNIIVNCLRRRRLVNIGITWNDISNERINELLLMFRIKGMRFAEAAPADPYHYLENNGLLVIPPTGILDLSITNRAKYVQDKYEVLYELPSLMRVLTAKENFEYTADFSKLYNTTLRLLKKQEQYKSAPVATREAYGFDDPFPVRITSKFGWRMEAETIDPRHQKLAGKILLEMPPRRPKMTAVKEKLNVGDIIMVYRSNRESYMFEIYDAFEDFYRKYACGCPSEERLAIFMSYYPNGTEWLTEDGMHVGIDKSKIEQLDDEEKELFYQSISEKIPIVLKTYKDAPDMYKDEFNMYGEPYDLFGTDYDGATFTADEADDVMLDKFLEHSRAEAEDFGEGCTGEFEPAEADECSLLVPVIYRIGNCGKVSCLARLEYNTAAAMICKMTGRKEELAYIEYENSYLYELVQFASNGDIKPLSVPKILEDSEEARVREKMVGTLTRYKKRNVIKFSPLLASNTHTNVHDKVEALVTASNNLIDIIDESELNNIKQSIARMLNVEDEYVSILNDRTYYGVESITQEFKSSAVFPPYNQRKSPQDIVDPELQKWAIIKAVCGFLNSRSGGDLLIGVNDEGYAAGLEDDMRELHARRYISTRDIDHYRLYIQRILTRAFAEVDGSKDPSEIANTHIDTFPETNAEGRTILRIKVSPYQRKIIRLSADKKDRPVGIEDSYVRQSGRTVVITPGMVEEIMKYKR